MRLSDDVRETTRIRDASDDPLGLNGNGRANGFLLGRNIAAMKRCADFVTGIFRPLHRTLEEIGPCRVAWWSVRNPIVDRFSAFGCAKERCGWDRTENQQEEARYFEGAFSNEICLDGGVHDSFYSARVFKSALV